MKDNSSLQLKMLTLNNLIMTATFVQNCYRLVTNFPNDIMHILTRIVRSAYKFALYMTDNKK